MDGNPYDEAYYTGGRGAYKSYEYSVRWNRRAARLLRRFPYAGTFLDVACARGFLLRGYVENGVDVADVNGFDISRWATDNAEPLVRHRVQRCSIFDFNPCGKKWDLVTAYDFLEHIPRDRMREAVGILEECCEKYLQVVFVVRKVDWDTDETHQTILPLDEWVEFFSLKLHTTETKPEHIVTATFERTRR